MTDVERRVLDIERLRGLAERADPKHDMGGWYTVEQPWLPPNCETYIIAGNNDPHAGVMVCDFQDIGTAGAEDKFTDDEWTSRNWALAEYVAALDPQTVLALLDTITEAHGKIAVLVEALTTARPTVFCAAEEAVYDNRHAVAADRHRIYRHIDNVFKDLPAAAQSFLEKLGWMEAQSNYFENECKEYKQRAEAAEARVAAHEVRLCDVSECLDKAASRLETLHMDLARELRDEAAIIRGALRIPSGEGESV